MTNENKIILYEDQVDSLAKIRRAYKLGHRRVLFQLPTGGGKTVIAAYITMRLAQQGKRVLALVHKRVLIEQMTQTIAQTGFIHDLGVIAAGYPMKIWAPLQVASINTLIRRDFVNPHPDFIIVDEAHHARAKAWELSLIHI